MPPTPAFDFDAAVAAIRAARPPLGEADANRVTASTATASAANAAKPAAPKPAAAKPRKRKSDALETEGSASASASAPAPKKQSTKKRDDPLPDLSGIRLPGDESMSVPVYDTCDDVRTKIRAALRKDGVTKAAFLRALVKAAYGAESTHKIAPNLLANFLNKKGPASGNTSSVFYAAYVFFEKLRVRDGKPKSKKRQEMEERWGPDGFETERALDNVWVTVHESETLGIDKYGRTVIGRRRLGGGGGGSGWF